MSEPAGLIGRENLSTVVAVAAVTALLALAYGVYLSRQIEVVAVGAAALDTKAARRDVGLQQQIDALQKRIIALEAAAAASRQDGAPVAGTQATTVAISGAEAAGSVPVPR
ncbi:MAG: hypothetical protein ACK4YP_08200 [Myxococcota bacterium]